jgi:hypothetical protein
MVKLSRKKMKLKVAAFALNRAWTSGFILPERQREFDKFASQLLRDIQFPIRRDTEAHHEEIKTR